MKLAGLAVLWCAGTAFGQGFSQLATDLDGSVLYFSSPLRLRYSGDYLHPKIYKWDSVKGFALYDQRPSGLPFPLPLDFGTLPFQLFAPDVSSDGSVVAVTGVGICTFSDQCVLTVEQYQSTIYRTGQPTIVAPGSAVLSRNGRYALLRSSVPSTPINPTPQITLLDLQTGQQTTAVSALAPLGGKHRVANDGTIVTGGSSGGFSLGQLGQSKSIPAPVAVPQPQPFIPDPVNPLINATASLVIYQAGGGTLGSARLSAYSIANGSSTDLVTETAAAPDFRASISDDGSLVAMVYGSNSQMYVIGSNGAGLRQVTTFPEPVTEIELSGDGTVAFVVTAANRISRVTIVSAQSVDIVPPTPHTTAVGIPFLVSRGSVTSIPGSGFAAASSTAQPQYPFSLGGVELHSAGVVVRVAGVSPTSIGYPATWDLPANEPVDVEVWASSAAASPFVPGFQVESLPPATLAIAHQSFLSLVSAASPAQPGETLHFYVKDLGPAIPAPPAGLPGPFQPLSELALPISCTLGQTSTAPYSPVSVNVSYAGLAPGLLNAFQVDIAMPGSFQGNPSQLTCSIGDPSFRNVWIVGNLPVQ